MLNTRLVGRWHVKHCRFASSCVNFLCCVGKCGQGRPLLCDNKAAVSSCSDRKETKRTKHIDIVHHFARDRVASGELKFVYCKSEENVSDCLTKALPRPLLEMGLRGLGML
jgi:hypothetical protein